MEPPGDLCEGEPPVRGTFYSVYLPPEARPKGQQACQCVFTDKFEALKVVKKTKKARFKCFDVYQDALNFASVGEVELCRGPSVGEKPSPFKAPKPQDLIKLRKLIEGGDLEGFAESVWQNPRHLVSSGDTPSILQEGFRYNALHISAKAKNAPITEFILTTISSPKFVKLLYGTDVQNEDVDHRIHVLLDLYLNTPDKGLNETPLHFASKFGAAEVVEVLVSFPQCDRTLKNKYGQAADMIICERTSNTDSKKKIAMHLENSFYVPVLRAEDNSMPPLIGIPFSPGDSPVLKKDPLSPRLEIHAYAGPMNKESADKFRKMWKTHPRTSTPKKDAKLDNLISLRYKDASKGLERLGERLAQKFDVCWKEYWPFLDCFIDITSSEGLGMLENFFEARIMKIENSFCPGKNLSTIADLCVQMEKCNLSDSFDDFNAFLCVEKACNVFANRIASDIYNRVFEDFTNQVASLENQIKQVELLVLSYMDDCRFIRVNFAQLHPRLGYLTGQKMLFFIERDFRGEYVKILEQFLQECVKAFDCFSSDDEGNYPKDNKPTSSKKQLICVMQNILKGLEQEQRSEVDEEMDCKEVWSRVKECSCIYHFKRVRRGMSWGRNNGSKYTFKSKCKKVLNFTKGEEMSSDEEFYTPPSSPCDSDEENEEFSDVQVLSEIFIEDECPTRTDCNLFKALNLAECWIDREKYPNTYRWYHNVGLYTAVEREAWPEVRKFNSVCATPPRYSSTQVVGTPPSWLRITGVNSPRGNLQHNKTNS